MASPPNWGADFIVASVAPVLVLLFVVSPTLIYGQGDRRFPGPTPIYKDPPPAPVYRDPETVPDPVYNENVETTETPPVVGDLDGTGDKQDTVLDTDVPGPGTSTSGSELTTKQPNTGGSNNNAGSNQGAGSYVPPNNNIYNNGYYYPNLGLTGDLLPKPISFGSRPSGLGKIPSFNKDDSLYSQFTLGPSGSLSNGSGQPQPGFPPSRPIKESGQATCIFTGPDHSDGLELSESEFGFPKSEIVDAMKDSPFNAMFNIMEEGIRRALKTEGVNLGVNNRYPPTVFPSPAPRPLQFDNNPSGLESTGLFSPIRGAGQQPAFGSSNTGDFLKGQGLNSHFPTDSLGTFDSSFGKANLGNVDYFRNSINGGNTAPIRAPDLSGLTKDLSGAGGSVLNLNPSDGSSSVSETKSPTLDFGDRNNKNNAGDDIAPPIGSSRTSDSNDFTRSNLSPNARPGRNSQNIFSGIKPNEFTAINIPSQVSGIGPYAFTNDFNQGSPGKQIDASSLGRLFPPKASQEFLDASPKLTNGAERSPVSSPFSFDGESLFGSLPSSTFGLARNEGTNSYLFTPGSGANPDSKSLNSAEIRGPPRSGLAQTQLGIPSSIRRRRKRQAYPRDGFSSVRNACNPTFKMLVQYKRYGGACFLLRPEIQAVYFAQCSNAPCSGCRFEGGASRCTPDYNPIWVFSYCEQGPYARKVSLDRIQVPSACTCKTTACVPNVGQGR